MSNATEPAALPPALLTKATAAIFRAQGFTETSAMIRHLEQGWRPDLTIESVEDAKRDAAAALQAAGLPALLQALQDVARIASRGDVNIQPLLLPIREAADRALRQVLGVAYKEGE